MMRSAKNFGQYSKSFFFFLKVCKLLSVYAKFQVNQQQFSIHKKVRQASFTPNPRQRLRGQNTLVGIGLIEHTEPTYTLIHAIFKHCILQTLLHVFLFSILVWNKIFWSNNLAIFYIFLIWFVLQFLYFWCSQYKVKGIRDSLATTEYNLLEIAIKIVL